MLAASRSRALRNAPTSTPIPSDNPSSPPHASAPRPSAAPRSLALARARARAQSPLSWLLSRCSLARPTAVSPFAQKPFKGALEGYLFWGVRRLAAQVPYFAPPFLVGYAVYSWGKEK